MLKPSDDSATGSKHVLTTQDGIEVVWIWSGKTWRLVDGVRDNTPEDMTDAGWSYARALA